LLTCPGIAVSYIKLANGIEPGYQISHSSGKLYQLRVGPFEVIEPVGRLAYLLKLPSTWRVHSVISIATFNLIATTRTAVKNLPRRQISMSRAKKSSRSKLFATINGVNVTNGGSNGGYGLEQTTWEPIEHLRNSQSLVDPFEHTGASTLENTSAIVNFASTLFLQTRPPPTNPYYCTNLLPDNLGPLYTPSPPPPTHIPCRHVRSVCSLKLTEA